MDCTAISASVSEILRMLQSLPPRAISSSLDTAYSKYSKSNYAASEQEIPAIREIISQREEKFHEIDTIIQGAETIVHCLREMRDQVVSSMKIHEGFVSRIRRLPIDILSEIFTQCLPEDRYILPDARAAPLLLTWVCRHWREAALDTPGLWRSLAVWGAYGEVESQIALYDEYWIKNAKLCPLTLDLELGPDSLENTTLINFSRRYTNRCMDLDVGFDDTRDLYRLLGDVPILERLTLEGSMGSMLEQEISIVQPHPRLRTLIIDCPVFPVNFVTMFNPGWANLTHLVVRRGSGPTSPSHRWMFSMLLQICPNLDHFIFSPIQLNQHDNQISLTHPKLRVLGIMNLRNDSGPLHDTFTFPNLRRLHVDRYYTPATILDALSVSEQPSLDGSGRRIFSMTGYVNRDITHAWTLLQVFNPGWSDLTHITLDVEGTAVLVFMPPRLCPHLEEIVFSSIDATVGYPHNDSPVTHPMLRSLVLRVNGGPVGTLLDMLTLPALRHLDLTLPQGSDWPHRIFKEFVHRSECLLETLKIGGANISAEEREEIASLNPA